MNSIRFDSFTYLIYDLTYLHGSLQRGGLETFSFPHGTVILVALQKQVISLVSLQG